MSAYVGKFSYSVALPSAVDMGVLVWLPLLLNTASCPLGRQQRDLAPPAEIGLN